MVEVIPPPNSPDELFQKGLEALERRSHQEAISLIQSAIDLDRQDSSSKSPRMRYVSYLGLALTLSQGRSQEGLKLCEQAVKRDFFDPDLFCNLGIAYLRNRQKKLAFQAFRKGLVLKPTHRRIREELERSDRRGSRVFTFLPRSHPINRLAGLVRYRLLLLFHRTDATQG